MLRACKTSSLIRRCFAVLTDALHADNGAIQRSSTLGVTLERLGIEPTYSRPRVSNDNPFSESLFRTCKYRPDYPVEGFSSIEHARQWTLKFVIWYNTVLKHSALKFITPVQRHTRADIDILAQRKEVYEKAKSQHPERWSSETRNWTMPETVILNPDKLVLKAVTKLENIK